MLINCYRQEKYVFCLYLVLIKSLILCSFKVTTASSSGDLVTDATGNTNATQVNKIYPGTTFKLNSDATIFEISETTWNGDIDSTISTYEFDTDNGNYIRMSHVAGDIYVVYYTSLSLDNIYLKTIEITSAGAITQNTIDTQLVTNLDGWPKELMEISTNVFVASYELQSDEGIIKTYSISSAGEISNSHLDTLTYFTDVGKPHFERVDEDTFVVVYSDNSDSIDVKTIGIDSDGDITGVIDTWALDGRAIGKIINLGNNNFAVFIRYNGGAQRRIRTFSIADNGIITKSVIDTDTDEMTGDYNTWNILHINGNVFVDSYTRSGVAGGISTHTIDTNGNISNDPIDTLEGYDTYVSAPRLIHLKNDLYAISYRGPGNDGIIKVIRISDDGQIQDIIMDTYTFDDFADQPFMIEINEDVYAVGYSGVDYDGFIKTLEFLGSANIEFNQSKAVGIYEVDYIRGNEITGEKMTLTNESGGYSTDYYGAIAKSTGSIDASNWGNWENITITNTGAVYYSFALDVGDANEKIVILDTDDSNNARIIVKWNGIRYQYNSAGSGAELYSSINPDLVAQTEENLVRAFSYSVEQNSDNRMTKSDVDSFVDEDLDAADLGNSDDVRLGMVLYSDDSSYTPLVDTWTLGYTGAAGAGGGSSLERSGTGKTSIINATDTISEIFQTGLAGNAEVGDTTISVLKGTGISLNDVLLVTDGIIREMRTVQNRPTSNTISVDAMEYSWLSSSGVDVTVLTGIKHSFSFNTTTTSRIEALRFTFDESAQNDEASFNGVSFNVISGITAAVTPSHTVSQHDYAEFDADNSQVLAGTQVQVEIIGVKNPTGVTTTSYAITIELLQSDGQVVDTVDVYFGVDTGVAVKADVDSILTLMAEDDGVKNNLVDDVNTAEIRFGNLKTFTLSDSGTGHGIDGLLLTVSTNGTNGYTITLHDTQVGLVNVYYTGDIRSNEYTDDGINDVTGGVWPGIGIEAYGYAIDTTCDFEGVGTYQEFSNNPVVVKVTNNSVTNEQVCITVRAQISDLTPAGDYMDIITYTVVSNY